MDKTFFVVLLAIIFISIKSEFDLCSDIKSFPEGVNSEGDKEDYCMIFSTDGDNTHCCYFRTKELGEMCKQITDDAYENIKRYKVYLKNTYTNVKIKCASGHLTFSVFALLALLF